MEYFGLKLGKDLGNRAAHPYQKFRGVSPPPREYDLQRNTYKGSVTDYSQQRPETTSSGDLPTSKGEQKQEIDA